MNIVTIKILEDAAELINHPRIKPRILDALYKMFQSYGMVVSIDVDESVGETSPGS
jgi:hypothetical protein